MIFLRMPCLLEGSLCAPVQSAPLVALDFKRKLERLGAPSPGGFARDVVHAEEPPAPREGESLSDVDRERKERVGMLRALIAKKQADTASRVAKQRAPEPLPGELLQTADGPLHRVARYLGH